MSATAKIEVLGAKETIRALGKIDKELRKQFTRDAKKIAEPVFEEARKIYPKALPVSGMGRKWSKAGRQLFPYDPAKASRGLKLKINTGKRSENVLLIQQKDPATAVFETIGKTAGNRLEESIASVSYRMPGIIGDVEGMEKRVLTPASLAAGDKVTKEMEQLVLEMSRRVQRQVS
jgi:hypothetical protein